MAVSTTTFAQRMSKITSGQSTSWTIPGQGLATSRDERRFLACSPQGPGKRSLCKPILAVISGAFSVILARWIDFTYFDTLLALAAGWDIDLAVFIGDISTALCLAVIIALVSLAVLGLRGAQMIWLILGFACVFVLEADLVAQFPNLYARIYPPSWVADMTRGARLTT